MSLKSLGNAAIAEFKISMDGIAARWIRRVSADVDFIMAGGLTVTGTVREIRYDIGTASEASASSLPAGAIVNSAELNVTTPYTGGTSITLGTAADPDAFMLASDNDPTAAHLYQVSQDTAAPGAPTPVLATVAGAPGAGAATVIIRYSVPDA